MRALLVGCALVAQPALGAPERRPAADSVCEDQLARPWPAGPVSRQAQISQMLQLRPQCIDHAAFLALLGALLLEHGDAEQALVWLERSLLLDPANLGAQADMAFALAALGQPSALQDMAQSWRSRTDLPEALRARLYPADSRSSFSLPNARLGLPERTRWGVAGDLSLLVGHEDNLSRSPRLTEITLTIPDGEFVQPVNSQRRSGGAGLATASFLAAYAPLPSTILRTGLALSARNAVQHRQTDFQQTQWLFNATHSWKGLRAQVDYSSAWLTGRLGEPFRQQKTGLALDLTGASCRLRVGADHEERSFSFSSRLDSRAEGATLSGHCAVGSAQDWVASISYRSARDRPVFDTRPGGEQTTRGWVVRAAGPLFWGLKADASLRSSRAADTTGFNELLENNAVRTLSLRQMALELAYPFGSSASPRAEVVLQLENAQQTSNLPLFSYRAESVYSGLRWSW